MVCVEDLLDLCVSEAVVWGVGCEGVGRAGCGLRVRIKSCGVDKGLDVC